MLDVFCWSLSPIFKFKLETLSQICFLQEVFDNEFTSGDGKPGSYLDQTNSFEITIPTFYF